MGVRLFGSRDSYGSEYERSIGGVSIDKYGVTSGVVDPNPRPDRYNIIRHKQLEGFLVIEIQYVGCTNYEGRKILVYERCTLDGLLGQKLIDPHFSENKNYRSPVARFEPTENGWNMAIKFFSL